MEAKAQPKKTTTATMQMDQLTMNNKPNTKEMITMATIHITMIIAIAHNWPISSTKHISRIYMI